MTDLDVNRLGGYERFRWWRDCKDGWKVGYTTTPLVGGSHPGLYAVAAYRPTGKGARSGSASRWELAYLRVYRRRKDARARSVTVWNHHEHP